MKGRLFRSTYLRLSKTILFVLAITSIFGQKKITVLDSNGQALIGVESFNENYSFATISDIDGVIKVPATYEKNVIYLKYLGFETLELDLNQIDLKKIEVNLKPTSEILEEVILVGRSDIRSRDFLQKIDAINNEEIALTNPQTSVDALARNADVYIQKSQMGGGSPVIRGFEANKVLLVVDGVRMNNAIYRNGHLQNAITVDNSVLEQMEVIYGPSSLMYGSDALGGVIHFRTKDPELNLTTERKANVFGHYYARYGSANQEKTAHADVNIGFRNWGSLTSITFSDFSDLRMGSRRTAKYPDYGKRERYQTLGNERGVFWPITKDTIVNNPNPNIQVGTAYSQLDLLQKLKYQINDRMNLIANFQYSTSSDIPRYDQLILEERGGFEFAEWNYGPQDRFLGSLKYKWTESRNWMDEMTIIASRQNIEESRIQRRYPDPFRQTGVENVNVNALTIDVSKEFKGRRRHRLYYGADLNNNFVTSEAWEENIVAGTTNDDLFTRYPSGGSSMNIMGAYAQYINGSSDSSFVFHGGLRYSTYTTKVTYLASDPIQWPSYFYEGIKATNSSVSWSAGINWLPSQNWTVRLLASSAFRAPNVDDIGKLRINNDNVVVPNTALEAEKSLNGEININRRLGRGSSISASAFFTRLNDAIVRQDFTLPDGSTTFMDGNRTYHVEANVNAEQAQILGFSANARFRLARTINLSSSISYIRGEVITSEETMPLAHIPPLYGKTQLSYSRNSWNLTLLSQYNGMKPISQYGGSTDNPEYATPEGALAWMIFNSYADYTWMNYTFQLGVENIFDKHYLPFASGVSGPGINLIVAIRGRF